MELSELSSLLHTYLLVLLESVYFTFFNNNNQLQVKSYFIFNIHLKFCFVSVFTRWLTSDIFCISMICRHIYNLPRYHSCDSWPAKMGPTAVTHDQRRWDPQLWLMTSEDGTHSCDSWPVKMGPTAPPKTLSGNLPRTPYKIPKTKNQYSFHGESLKSRLSSNRPLDNEMWHVTKLGTYTTSHTNSMFSFCF